MASPVYSTPATFGQAIAAYTGSADVHPKMFVRVAASGVGAGGVAALSVVPAYGTEADVVGEQLCCVLGSFAGGSAPYASGTAVILALFGIVEGLSGSPALGDPVYVGDDGFPSLTFGTNHRQIGGVTATGGGTYDFLFMGATAGSGGTPSDAPYILNTDTLPSGFTGGAARLLQDLVGDPLLLVRTDASGASPGTALALGSSSHAAEVTFALTPDTGSGLDGPYASVVATIHDNPGYGYEVAALDFWTMAHGTTYAPRMRLNGLGLQLKNSTGGGDMGVLKTDAGDFTVGHDYGSGNLLLRSGGTNRWSLRSSGELRSLGGSGSPSGLTSPLDLRNDQGGPGADGIGVGLFATVSNDAGFLTGAAGLELRLRSAADGAEQGQVVFAATRPSLSPYLGTWDWIDGLVMDTGFTAGGESSMGNNKLTNVAPGTGALDTPNLSQVSMPSQLVFGARSSITPHAGAIVDGDEFCNLGSAAVLVIGTVDPSNSILVPAGAGFKVHSLSVLAPTAPNTEDQVFSLCLYDGVVLTLVASVTLPAGGTRISTAYGSPATVAPTGADRALVMTYAQAAGGTLAVAPVINVVYALV